VWHHTEGIAVSIIRILLEIYFPAVKVFWKSVKNWQSYSHEYGVLIFLGHSIETYRVENDASDRLPDLSSASCDLDLLPPDPQSWTFHARVPWTNSANLHQQWLTHFQNIVFARVVTEASTDNLRALCLFLPVRVWPGSDIELQYQYLITATCSCVHSVSKASVFCFVSRIFIFVQY